MSSFCFRVLLFSFAIASFSHLNAQNGETRALFNGTDLTGWDGNPKIWSVENGMIIGRTTDPAQLKYNEFLIWRGGKLDNFELSAVIKVVGKNNSGIQYRSSELKEVGKWALGGYQCDVHPNPLFNGMVYHERGRGIVAKNGQTVIADPNSSRWLIAESNPKELDFTKFIRYTIEAKANRIVHKVDNKVVSVLEDYDPKASSLSGLLGFQIHRGPAMEVWIKSVELKELPKGSPIPFEQTFVPSDSQEIFSKKPNSTKPVPKAKPKPKAEPKKTKSTGASRATPVDRIKAPEGFSVELIYSVPAAKVGSWVALCNDDQGRIYASDQYGELYRFKPPKAGQVLTDTDIEKVPIKIRSINGMVFHRGVLYAGVNDYEGKTPSGLYRISDTDNNDQLDKVELLRELNRGADHGTHAVVPSVDGESLYLITGNNVKKTATTESSPVLPHWGDDHLLPRMPDGRGHNRHVLAPGGIIYKVSLDGKEFETVASGFRNIYDASINKDGELFTYDADMEYDFNTPWYRPTRVNHVVSGGEYGWRNGAGKYPEFYYDNLPSTINIGPGSPTGTCFGYGAKWPAKYQQALYVLDWSWGKIYAVNLKAQGSTYTGQREEFITGAPLPVTDAIIHPKDGAMYFAIGGRRVQSGLYRVTYQGEESTAAADLKPTVSPERKLRHELEAFHGKQDQTAIDKIWANLDHQDRWTRWAARIALEHQPLDWWVEKAFTEQNASKQLEAMLALVHVTGKCPSHRDKAHIPFVVYRDRVLDSCNQLSWEELTTEQQSALVRLIQITMHRFGKPDEAMQEQLITMLDPHFPANAYELNWLLCDTLVYLQAPNTAKKGMALIAAAASQEPQMQFARSLRHLKTGWTPELREQQLEWLLKAYNYRGGASFAKFVEFIRNDSLATFSDQEKQTHAELIAKKPVRKSAFENVGAVFAGRESKNWTLEELSAAATDGMKNRDYKNGRTMFTAAACYACHQFGNAGGMNGPNLTGARGRYSPHDLLDSIIHPSKEINEQFAPIVVTKNDGSIVSGVVVNLFGDRVVINNDLSDPNQRINIDRKEVKKIETSKVSPMPPMLLARMNTEEILDLLAYILSGGDETDAMFGE